MADTAKRLYTVADLAGAWGMSDKSVRRKIVSGELRARRLPGGGLRVPLDEVERYERSLVPAVPEVE